MERIPDTDDNRQKMEMVCNSFGVNHSELKIFIDNPKMLDDEFEDFSMQ